MSNREYQREIYVYYKSKGICTRCRKEKAVKGKTMCVNCLEESSEYHKRHYHTYLKYDEHTVEKRKKRHKRKKDLCVAFGICYNCTTREALKGRGECLECYTKRRNRAKTNAKDIPRSMRIEMGLCYYCGDPVVEGSKLCAKHLVGARQRMTTIHAKNSCV